MLNNFPRLYTATNPTKGGSKPDYSLFIWSKLMKRKHPYFEQYGITLSNARVHIYQGLNRIVITLTDSIAHDESDLDIKALHFINKEGFAAARSISEAIPEVYAITCISAYNIKHVTFRIRELLPDSKIAIAGSNNGASKRESEKSTQALGGNCQVIYPTQGGNFNDMFKIVGSDNPKKYIQGVPNVEKEIIYAQR